MAQSFDDTLQRVLSASRPSPDWPGFFVRLFAVTGASISTLGPLLGSETLSASNSTAARLDEIQFDLGEGPCWDAMRSAHPVFVPDMRRSQSRWPGFADAVGDEVRSVHAFPLRVGPLQIGAIDMYSAEVGELDDDQTHRAGLLARAMGQQVLRAAITDSSDLHVEAAPTVFSRRIIHQATGMVLAQLGVSADDALLVLQGHAFAEGRTMMEVAQRVVDRTLDFSREESADE